MRARSTRPALRFDWSRCVLGCGLAGVNNRDWLAAFHAQAPALRGLAVESDAYTTLLGAHGGAPGVIVALGTGSIAAALDRDDGECRIVRRLRLSVGRRSERRVARPASRSCIASTCSTAARPTTISRRRCSPAPARTDRDESRRLALRSQSDGVRDARAESCFEHRAHPVAARLLGEAGVEIGKLVAALDPSARLPVALVRRTRPRRCASIVPQIYQRAFARAAGRLGARRAATRAARSGASTG